jgi:predicted dithiol-disulfide oxidoreductase (DUF899 family)
MDTQVHYPGESENYRKARNELLTAEMELRRRVAEVALLRANLPLGGAINEDYRFMSSNGGHSLSELFADNSDSLILYSFMYPEGGSACPMCTAFLDSLNGSAPHITQRTSLAVVGQSPIEVLQNFANRRGWRNLKMLSTAGTTYNSDYHGETAEGQIPMMNVFVRRNGRIHHFYGTELFFTPNEDGQHARHIDAMWPLWNVFDLLPEGRGENWFPQVDYVT